MAYGANAVDNPEWFKYTGPMVSRYEIVGMLTASVYSSHDTNWYVHPVNFPAAVACSNIYGVKSLNAGVPAATSQASSGVLQYTYSHGVTAFKRVNYGASSASLTTYTTASGGLTATLSYTGTGAGGASQTFGVSWVTDTTGGVSALTTTSGAGNWSSYLTGPKLFPIPCVTTFSAGEYWLFHRHSSTTGVSGSNVTLASVSNLNIGPQWQTFGVLGESVTRASVALQGFGPGIANAVTTTAAMPGAQITANPVNLWVHELSNV